MKIPGMRILRKAERKGNEAEVPRTEGLGLVNFLKLTFKEVSEDHVMAYAGNLTYKALFAIFPLSRPGGGTAAGRIAQGSANERIPSRSSCGCPTASCGRSWRPSRRR